METFNFKPSTEIKKLDLDEQKKYLDEYYNYLLDCGYSKEKAKLHKEILSNKLNIK